MKRFDVNCFLGKWPFHSCRFSTADALRAAHEKAGITGGLVSSVDSVFYLDPLSAEKTLHDELSGLNGYGQIFSLNPLLPAAVELAAEALERFHIRGIRLTRGYHGFSWHDPRVRALLAFAEKSGLAVLLSLRLEDGRLDYIVSPLREDTTALGAALGDMPDIPVILTHIYQEELTEIREAMLRRRNTYADLSYFKSSADCLERAADAVGCSRLVFGSGYPLGTLQSAVTLLEHAAISDTEKNDIWWNNAARIFGL